MAQLQLCAEHRAIPNYLNSGKTYKCPYACGYEFLQYFGVSWSGISQVVNMIVLHCWMAFFLFTAYLALRYINHIKR